MVQTGLVESARYFDLGKSTSECWDFLDELNKCSSAPADVIPRLLIFDGLHHVAHPFGHGEEDEKKSAQEGYFASERNIDESRPRLPV